MEVERERVGVDKRYGSNERETEDGGDQDVRGGCGEIIEGMVEKRCWGKLGRESEMG